MSTDALTTEKEMIEWEEIANQVESDLGKLIYEAQYRFKKI